MSLNKTKEKIPNIEKNITPPRIVWDAGESDSTKSV
jgi:hypothetical protein